MLLLPYSAPFIADMNITFENEPYTYIALYIKVRVIYCLQLDIMHVLNPKVQFIVHDLVLYHSETYTSTRCTL